MNESKQELLRGTLDMLVLKVVALGPSHGYAIAQRLRQISKEFFQVHQGSLYPALHRLEDKGWLQAEWKESETAFGQKTRPGRGPEPEIIPLRTLMVNQAWEVFCQRRFPPSLIYVADPEPTCICPVNSYAASLS